MVLRENEVKAIEDLEKGKYKNDNMAVLKKTQLWGHNELLQRNLN